MDNENNGNGSNGDLPVDPAPVTPEVEGGGSDRDGNIVPRYIEDEMRTSYIDYAMSVIIGRALPDVRDGLKPVHRRILHSMNEQGFTHSKPYKKSARIVGDVLGKYHPHGDAAVYDTMVRMAQDFSLRYTFIDGHGNFGSVDGDSAAAMRYTEARLSRVAEEMLVDLEKETVPFKPNYDETLLEPEVMPAKIPNLLVNGSSGIAVGMATNIPPHNLTEVIDGAISLIDNPNVTNEDLMEHIKGPDFPTGGIIYGIKGIREAFETGRGRVVVRAKCEIIEEGRRPVIIVTEIPYQVNKSRLLEKIAGLVREKKLPEISDLRDESDREGMRIVIELKRDCIPTVVLNKLYKHTDMESTFGVIMLALVDNRPVVLNLREMLRHFVDHRRDIVRRRTRYELRKAEERAHILEGLLIALDNIDRIIEIIRGSRTTEDAMNGLMQEFGLSELQTKAILEMRLARLVGLERDKIKAEYEELLIKIEDLKDILRKPARVLAIIKEELLDMSARYGDARRTEIVAASSDFSMEDLIANEEVAVTVSHHGYIKRQRLDLYKSQSRGGRGMSASQTKEEDFIQSIFAAMTHDFMLFFTDRGKVFWLKVYDIPEASRQSKGKPIINLIDIEAGEKILTMISVSDFDESKNLVFATSRGIIKKTNLAAYSRPRKAGIRAINIDEGDTLIGVRITDGDNNIMLGTAMGKAVQFNEADARTLGRVSRGVKGIRLRKGDSVVGMEIVEESMSLFTITENGYGKRTPISDYPVQHRGGMGVINIKSGSRNGMVITVREVDDEKDLMVVTESGMLIRIHASEVSVVSRNTMGVRIIRLKEGDKVVAVEVLERSEGDDDGPAVTEVAEKAPEGGLPEIPEEPEAEEEFEDDGFEEDDSAPALTDNDDEETE